MDSKEKTQRAHARGCEYVCVRVYVCVSVRVLVLLVRVKKGSQFNLRLGFHLAALQFVTLHFLFVPVVTLCAVVHARHRGTEVCIYKYSVKLAELAPRVPSLRVSLGADRYSRLVYRAVNAVNPPPAFYSLYDPPCAPVLLRVARGQLSVLSHSMIFFLLLCIYIYLYIYIFFHAVCCSSVILREPSTDALVSSASLCLHSLFLRRLFFFYLFYLHQLLRFAPLLLWLCFFFIFLLSYYTREHTTQAPVSYFTAVCTEISFSASFSFLVIFC
jgi:hypothetical protein